MKLSDLDVSRVEKIVVTRRGGRIRTIHASKEAKDVAYFLKKHRSEFVDWLESENRWVSVSPSDDYVAFRIAMRANS